MDLLINKSCFNFLTAFVQKYVTYHFGRRNDCDCSGFLAYLNYFNNY